MKRCGLYGWGEITYYKTTWSLDISVTDYYLLQGSKLIYCSTFWALLSNVLQPKTYCLTFLIKDLVLLQCIASKENIQWHDFQMIYFLHYDLHLISHRSSIIVKDNLSSSNSEMSSFIASIHVIAWVIEALMGCTLREIEIKTYISFIQF